jgi:exosortase E/protease (VPEID-CTERM system)
MIAAWFAGGVASFATLFRLSFGSAWRRVAVALRGLFAAGLLLGLCAWFVGLRTLPLWDWLAGASLQTSAWMLIPFADSVHVIPDEMLLGVGDFEVTIAAECSGMENLGGVSVFLLGYFYAFRHQLRFPQSFLLVPLALGAVWLINSMRIAGLILVGANFSADVALGGFHSKAGWLGLCLVALAVVVGTRNSPRFAWAEPQQRSTFTDSATAAYLLPLLTYVGVGLVTGLFASGVDWLYPVQVVAGAAVAWSYRQEYPKPIRHLPWWGLLMGAVAFALWVAFERTPVEEPHEAHEQGLAEASSWLRNTWLFFRVLGAVALVPVIEELAFRGFLQRRVIGEDFTSVAQDKFTWFSLGVSALAFGLLHESWLAGVLAGVAYSIACYRRGRLEEAVVAHAVTNGLLVVASLGLGYRHLWH